MADMYAEFMVSSYRVPAQDSFCQALSAHSLWCLLPRPTSSLFSRDQFWICLWKSYLVLNLLTSTMQTSGSADRECVVTVYLQ